MTDTERRALERNIGKFSWYKIFTKRVFLPLIAIQLVQDGGVTPSQIGTIAIVAAIVQAVLQMPAGYLADRYGNRFAILLGSAISAPSALFYIFMPNFIGGLIAAVLFFGGYAFQSGANEAFMHDTLKALGLERKYTSVMGRAQSRGLIGNTLLLILVPATYSINHNLPFIIGFFSLCAMFGLAYSFHYPKIEKPTKLTKNPVTAMRKIVTKSNIVLFIFAGIMTGIATRAGEYRELLFEDTGIAVGLFGLIIASSSIVGAVMGRFLHVFDKLSPKTFYVFDVGFMAACFAMAGIGSSHITTIVGMVLFTAYSRVRLIVFQSKLLEDVTHVYKATLLSGLNFFTVFGEVAAVAVLTTLITNHGYSNGYLFFGLSTLAIGIILWLGIIGEERLSQK